MSASDKLRASVAALPEEIRDVWAPNRGADQVVGAKYAIDPIDFVVADDLEKPVMEHIALTASPDRVLALADLLDAHRLLAALNASPVPQADRDLADRMRERSRLERAAAGAAVRLEASIEGTAP